MLRPDSIGEEETSVAGKLPELTDGPIFCVDPIGLSKRHTHYKVAALLYSL